MIGTNRRRPRRSLRGHAPLCEGGNDAVDHRVIDEVVKGLNRVHVARRSGGARRIYVSPFRIV
jgi:hypothetical protein